MSFEHYFRRKAIPLFFLASGMIRFISTAHGNVYATNIKLNGSSASTTVSSGSAVDISYILNEPASSVTVSILSGTAVVRTLSNSPTNRGLNQISWDGRNSSGQNLAQGPYSISIMASSAGYANWTQLSSDLDDTNTSVIGGQGIAVDQNPGSSFYGRVFVANAWQGPDPGNNPGDALGVLKFNADTSGADEGIASTSLDGHEWFGENVSPWKVRVSADDYVYVSDLATGGDVYRWDPTISSNSLAGVLRQDNRPPGSTVFGPAVSGSGSNTQIWMNNTNSVETQGLELRRWLAGTGGACATNDLGTPIVAGGTNLSFGPAAVDLDKSGNIYICQFVSEPASPLARVFRYRAYDPSTNGGQPETAADWAVGNGDDTYAGASDVAVDPSGTYVAVAFQGTFDPVVTNGNTKILYATNGALAVNLDLNIDIDGIGDATHQDTACAWDAVGNLYYIDNWVGNWRVVSPPGANSATTVWPSVLQVGTSTGGGSVPEITGITVSNGVVWISFSAQNNDVVSYFALLAASSASGPYSTVAAASIQQIAPGQFQAMTSSSGGMQYFKIQRVGGSTPPPPQDFQITGLSLSSATVTIQFTGSTNDLATAFTLLSANTVTGPYAATLGAAITAVGPGTFRATAPASGPQQFYRVQK